MMMEDKGDRAFPAARAATPSGLSPSVLGQAGIANAYRSLITWFGPFGMLIVGMLLLMVGAAGAKPTMAVCLIGGFIVLSAYETHAERAAVKAREAWAKLIADMVADERDLSISVNHTWESMRPHLDARIEEIIAQAMRAGTAETQGGSGRQPASAVADGHAPHPNQDTPHE